MRLRSTRCGILREHSRNFTREYTRICGVDERRDSSAILRFAVRLYRKKKLKNKKKPREYHTVREGWAPGNFAAQYFIAIIYDVPVRKSEKKIYINSIKVK